MERAKDDLYEAVEKLRRRMSAGEIDEAEFRAARDRLLERRVAQRPFEGPEQRHSPPPPKP